MESGKCIDYPNQASIKVGLGNAGARFWLGDCATALVAYRFPALPLSAYLR